MPHPVTATSGRIIRVAVVGSGPSGFYAIAALFKQEEHAVEVDLFDRLPTPFGLVRGGVAPDHQNIKAVIRVYDNLAQQDRFRFLGNVMVGRDVTLADLEAHYDAIVFATGNESERVMGIPGEDLEGVFSATQFVGWYNAHPDFRHLRFDLAASERVIVVGNGNVAMDVTRILAKNPDELASTDIADYALEELRRSSVREILILGRRGPAQVAFTPKEIKEVGSLEGVDLIVDPEAMELDEVTRKWMESQTSKTRRQNLDYLTEKSSEDPSGAASRIYLHLLVSPTEFVGLEGKLKSVRLEKNELYESEDGTPRPRGTGVESSESIDLAFTAVGYRGVPLPGVPFDDRRGVFCNRDGRIFDPSSGSIVPRQYVVGWAKRGPTGLIGSNVADAKETVELILEDLRNGRLDAPADRDPSDILRLLDERGVTRVSFSDWQQLDQIELAKGQESGKIREKFTRVERMMAALCPPTPR